MMTNRNSGGGQNVELRAAGFDLLRSSRVKLSSRWRLLTPMRINNRVQDVAQVILDALDEQGGQGLIVGRTCRIGCIDAGNGQCRIQSCVTGSHGGLH